MDIEIHPSDYLEGEILIPPSKSYSQRVLALAFLVDEMEIKGLGKSDDELAALGVLESCGFGLKEEQGVLKTKNRFDFNSNIEVNTGESGLSTRLFSSLLALNKGQTRINGRGSLLSREMGMLSDFYSQIGVEYQMNEGKLPITIKGNHCHQNIEVDGGISSQHISGILYYMVGLRSAENLILSIHNPMSIPYIDMTIDILNRIDAKVKWLDQNRILVEPSVLKSKLCIEVEGDWSSASFWMVAAALNGNMNFKNLATDSLQADRRIIEVLKQVGAKLMISEQSIRVQKAELNSFDFDATHCPDLIPILTVLALFCHGESTIIGVDRLIYKESDRLGAILSELSKISDSITHSSNKLVIKSEKNSINKSNIAFKSYADHRMIMSFAILALNLKHSCLIRDIEAINKSYPMFFDDLKVLTEIS